MKQKRAEQASPRRRVGAAPAEPTLSDAANDASLSLVALADGRSKPVVLVASTCAWPSAPKLAIALAGASCTVVSLAPAGHPLNLTRAVSRRFRYGAARPLHTLAEAIVRARPDLIVACDERVVEHLHRLHDQTADDAVRWLIERSLGRPDAYGRTTSRQSVIALAAELGILAPETRTMDSLADLRTWAETRPPPWVLKVDGSWGGLGVRIVSSLAEAERAFRDLSRLIRPLYALRRLVLDRDLFWMAPWLHQPPIRVTVQHYIEGPPANCAIAAWNGESLGGVAVDVVATDGETGPASVVRLAKDSQMLTAAAHIVRALGLSGMVGFDFVVERATGRLYLLEMNPRATPICHLRLGAGRDPVGALVARLCGAAAPQRPAETRCDTIALFPEADLQLRGHPILAGAYQDRPIREPRLVRALMRRRLGRRVSPMIAPGSVELG